MKQDQPLYLFDHQQRIMNKIKEAKKIILFLDYDGTLVGFKDDPEQVKTPADVIGLIGQLRSDPTYEIIIITGRTLKDITSKIPIHQIHYAAVHGLHIQHVDGTETIMNKADKIQSTLSKIKKQAQIAFSDEPNIRIEDKSFTLAFHYRMLSNKEKQSAKKRFNAIANDIIDTNEIELLKGDNVIEVRPQGWNKGTTVSYFLDHYQEDIPTLPIYIGDDTTDEDGFGILHDPAITIIVKNGTTRNTSASYWVHNPDDVVQFLSQLVASSTLNISE